MSRFPLPDATPTQLNLAAKPLFDLDALIRRHIDDGRYGGCQIAVARHGRLALHQAFGQATDKQAANDRTLWLMFSNTKVLTMAALWTLVDQGAVSFMDPVAMHLPDFAAHGKSAVTLHQVATHQGGFPQATVSRAAWNDHARMLAEICEFRLEWEPGTRLHYHPQSAHMVIAMVIEAATGQDFRVVIRERVLAPLGLGDDVFVGVPAAEQARCADMHGHDLPGEEPAAFRAAGLPHAGGYGTARGMAAFYQMMLNAGRLGDVRLFSPRLIAIVTRDATGERPDGYMSGIPMHRGLGPHVRATGERVRGLGTLASPATFGHGGVGSSYCWADPASGVSFAYLTDTVVPDPWHSLRMDRISNLIHAAID